VVTHIDQPLRSWHLDVSGLRVESLPSIPPRALPHQPSSPIWAAWCTMETRSVDCSELEAFQAFRDYVALLRQRTAFNETLLGECQVPICRALFGFGLPDLSGIGVSSIFNSARKFISDYTLTPTGCYRIYPLYHHRLNPLLYSSPLIPNTSHASTNHIGHPKHGSGWPGQLL